MNKQKSRILLVTKIPDEAGAFKLAANIIKKHSGNMSRIHYDRGTDIHTIFIEVECTKESQSLIKEELENEDLLLDIAIPLKLLELDIFVDNKTGELFKALDIFDKYRANISYINFDQSGSFNNKLRIRLDIEDSESVNLLLEELKGIFKFNIVSYDITGRNLDSSVFYLQSVQEIKEILKNSDPVILEKFLGETNHMAQELSNDNKDVKDVFEKVIQFIKTMVNSKSDFKADIKKIQLHNGSYLHNIQMPCGSNVYVLANDTEYVLFDTSYGIYYEELKEILDSITEKIKNKSTKTYLTHGDVDHVGSTGYFEDSEIWFNKKTFDVIYGNGRAIGSPLENSVLIKVYEKLVKIFSKYSAPKKENIRMFSNVEKSKNKCKECSIFKEFKYVDSFTACGIKFIVLEGLDAHAYGEMIYVSLDAGLVFTGDIMINIDDMTLERKEYNKIAHYLMNSVNIDSEKATIQRELLIKYIIESREYLETLNKELIICPGHGPLSVLDKDAKMIEFKKDINFKQ